MIGSAMAHLAREYYKSDTSLGTNLFTCFLGFLFYMSIIALVFLVLILMVVVAWWMGETL